MDAALPDDPHAWLFSRTRAGAARGPDRARTLLDALGAPDRAFRAVRVIGTNGKGSVSAMLEAGLLGAGARVGRFTSPHLERFEERVRVGGAEIPPERTRAFVDWARRHAPDAPFFDLALGLAAATFRDAGVEWAVMEAGVGGRSDATDALHDVAAVLLTNVALDHVATLGPTLRDIALDKAGAARPGVPLLTTATDEGLAVAREVAGRVGAPLYRPDTHPDLFAPTRPPRLAGPHQRTNAGLAVAALRLLGFEGGVEAALDAVMPGRLEDFDVEGRTVTLDGAHNPHAAQHLARAVEGAGVHVLVFGAFGRKAVEDLLPPLRAVARAAVFTSPGDLAADPHDLARRFGGEAEPDPARALRRALDLAPPGGRVLVTGSLYLVGAVRALLQPAASTS